MNEVVILCRRAIDWKHFRYPSSARSNFNLVHPVRDLVSRWNATAGNPPFHEYRQFLHSLAKSTWISSGARIVMNWVQPHEDGVILPHVLEICKDAEWIIPIDDDDWLAPFICSELLRIENPGDFYGATWPSMVVHFNGPQAMQEPSRSWLNETRKDITLSCSYAISRRAIKEWKASDLAAALTLHGTASVLFQGKPVKALDSIGAVHLRHRAAAGAASNTNRALDLRAMPFDVNKIAFAKTGEWARQYFNRINIKHETYGLPTPA